MKRLMTTLVLAFGLVLGTSAVAYASPHVTASPRVAAAADCYPNCDGGGGNTLHHKKPTTTPSTPPPTAQVNTASALAFTGADVAATLAIGVLLVGAGLVLVRVTRRRRVIV